jgi:hypothetical protein
MRLLLVRGSGSDAVGAERYRNCSDAVVSIGLPLGTRSDSDVLELDVIAMTAKGQYLRRG